MLGCCGSRRHHPSRRSDKNKQRLGNAGGRARTESNLSSYAPPTMLAAMNTGSDSRKGSVHSGPPPSVLKPEHALRPYREESDDEAGFIMGAWQPFQSQPTGYIPVKEPVPPVKQSGFSRVGGGRAHIDTPYAITGDAQSNTAFPSQGRANHGSAFANQSASSLPRSPVFENDSPPPSLSSPAARQQPHQDTLPPGAMQPFHIRTRSQTAIIEDPSMLMGMRRRDDSSSSAGPIGSAGTSRPPSRATRLDSAPPPSSYRHSAAASEDDRSSVDQPRKKPWFKLRRNRPHSSEGYRPQDEETPLEPLDIPPPSTTTPGKSFVVIRKNQSSPNRPPQGNAAGSSSAGPST